MWDEEKNSSNGNDNKTGTEESLTNIDTAKVFTTSEIFTRTDQKDKNNKEQNGKK